LLYIGGIPGGTLEWMYVLARTDTDVVIVNNILLRKAKRRVCGWGRCITPCPGVPQNKLLLKRVQR